MKAGHLRDLVFRRDRDLAEINALRRLLLVIDENIGLQRRQEYSLRNGCLSGATQDYTVEGIILMEVAASVYARGGRLSSEIFDEDFYLNSYEDVASAVSKGQFSSGFEHWILHGFSEGRPYKCKSVDVRLLVGNVIQAYASAPKRRLWALLRKPRFR